MGIFKRHSKDLDEVHGPNRNAHQSPPSYSEIDVGQPVEGLPPAYPLPKPSHFGSLHSHADDGERDAGDAFCHNNPLFPPSSIDEATLQRIVSGRLGLTAPPLMTVPETSKLSTWKRFKGEIQPGKGDGTVYIRSKKGTRDALFVSDAPLYAAHTYRNVRLYYEITITSLPHPQEATIAIGYAALPYPPFRLPGWHRGSIAVHSDDGRRYVNDSLGGKDFVLPFSVGETVGLGIDYARKTVFFTRNGKLDGEWGLVEDAVAPGTDPYRGYRDGGVEGIQGEFDVFAALGVYGSVGVVVNLGGSPFKYSF